MSLKELGNKLIHRAEVAFAFRQIDILEEAATILSSLPIKECQLIGQYYLAWCAYNKGLDSLAEFERVFENSKTYKARALISVAAIKARSQDYDAEIRCFSGSMKFTNDLTTLVKAAKGIAVAKAKQGDHQHALKDLEKISSLIQHASPEVYYDCLNSLAVELGEVGRKHEARNIAQLVVASPFIQAYPEWRSTADELRGKNRAFAVLRPTKIRKAKLLTMPIPEHGEVEELDTPARVINLQQWKIKMGKDDTPREELDDRELMMRIFQLTSAKERTEQELYRMLVAIEKVLAEHKNKDEDDED